MSIAASTLRLLRRLPPAAANLAVAVASAAVFLGATEGVCRLLAREAPPAPVAAYITDWPERDFYTIRSNATGWPPWEEYNHEGLRDREHAVAGAPGVRRIVCLGDSVTLGWGLPAQDAYPQLLQDLFDARGQAVEVFNVALGGWAPRQELIAYRRIVRQYHPDQVVLGLCLNDVAEMHNNLTRPPRLLQGLYLHSALVRRVVGARDREIRDVRELFSRPDEPRVRDGYRRLFQDVATLRDEARQDGAALAVALFPFRFQTEAGAPPTTAQREIAAFCAREQIPLLDLLPALQPLRSEGFIDDLHLSAAGSRRVAEEVLDSGLLAPSAGGTHPGGDARPASPKDRGASPAELLAALHGGDPAARSAAALALGNRGHDPGRAVPALTELLDDPSPRVRAAGAWALGRFARDAAPAVNRLAHLLDDSHPPARAGAAWSLGKIGERAALAAPALVRRLDDTDDSVRWRAADALGEIGSAAPGAVADLVQVLARPRGRGRAGAGWALGKLGPAARDAVPALTAALADPGADVRSRAAWALGEIGPAAASAVPALAGLVRDPEIGWRAVDALGGIGPAAAPAAGELEAALASPSGGLRWRAAKALGRIGPGAKAAEPRLLEALGDREDNVRVAAAKALAQVGPDARTLRPLARALGDPDGRVRYEAAAAIGRVGAAAHPFQSSLIQALADADANVRGAAARALRRIGPSLDASHALARMAAGDPDESARAEARRALRGDIAVSR
ncbi:MAG TPA: HEAT repeat domain-containing protein [Vicinamibacteria bacterium]